MMEYFVKKVNGLQPWFSDVFRVDKKGTLRSNGLTTLLHANLLEILQNVEN